MIEFLVGESPTAAGHRALRCSRVIARKTQGNTTCPGCPMLVPVLDQRSRSSDSLLPARVARSIDPLDLGWPADLAGGSR